MKLPTDGLAPANDIERIFLERINRDVPNSTPPIGANGMRLLGDAGFVVE